MELEIVNTVWRGQMKCNGIIDLPKLESCIRNKVDSISLVRIQNKQPEQLIIKFVDGSTMLIFKTGKFRIMGGKIDELEAHCNIISVTSRYRHNIPNIILQTMTVVYTYPNKIDLAKLSTMIKCFYNTESFPAVQVTKYKPIHVNVFASGKVIICGIKNIDDAKNIQNELDLLILI